MWRVALVLASIGILQTFSSRTLGVRVDVMVSDGRVPVAGLRAADFELRDNGVPQSLELIDTSEPINAVLALDVSSSTDGRRQADLRRASEALLAGLTRGDRAALITFSQAVAPRLPLTTDLQAVRASLASITPFGETNVMDGVFVALMTTQAQPGRSLVVVCTDGYDTSSWLSSHEVIEAAKRSNAVVYAVSAADAGASAELKDVSDATGGQTMKVASGGDLAGAFRRILGDFRSRYVLAFTPTGVEPGGQHRLDVRVKRSGLSVKARQGYIGVGTAR
jgi:VWFA-related protein